MEGGIRYVILLSIAILVVYALFKVVRETYDPNRVVVVDGKEVLKPKISPEQEAKIKKLQAEYDKMKAHHAVMIKKMKSAKTNETNVNNRTQAAINKHKSDSARKMKASGDRIKKLELELKRQQQASARAGKLRADKTARDARASKSRADRSAKASRGDARRRLRKRRIKKKRARKRIKRKIKKRRIGKVARKIGRARRRGKISPSQARASARRLARIRKQRAAKRRAAKLRRQRAAKRRAAKSRSAKSRAAKLRRQRAAKRRSAKSRAADLRRQRLARSRKKSRSRSRGWSRPKKRSRRRSRPRGRSDKRLKDNIKKIGVENGINVYSWTWNEIAISTYGRRGDEVGVIAQELPKNVVEYDEYGYLEIKQEPWIINLINYIKSKYKPQ